MMGKTQTLNFLTVNKCLKFKKNVIKWGNYFFLTDGRNPNLQFVVGQQRQMSKMHFF
jgi:hypothetical protein